MHIQVHPGESLLGKYRVERIIGRGGMGVVAAARHIELGELFAIKLLHFDASDDPCAVERFMREARTLARLRSEHVTRVYDTGRANMNAPYMVMEFLDGTDLRRCLQARGRFSWVEAVTCALQAAEGLADAHACGVVHRDVKPANLFLTQRKDKDPCIKVLDFGVAKLFGTSEPKITEPGVILGSPLYMAPEQLTAPRDVDARCDIWSIGVVLYELLTGVVPFPGPGLAAVLREAACEEPVPVDRMRTELPAALSAIVTRCLAKLPEQRFQTMNELAAALKDVLFGSRHRDAATIRNDTELINGSERIEIDRATRTHLYGGHARSKRESVEPRRRASSAAWSTKSIAERRDTGEPSWGAHLRAGIMGTVIGVAALAAGMAGLSRVATPSAAPRHIATSAGMRSWMPHRWARVATRAIGPECMGPRRSPATPRRTP